MFSPKRDGLSRGRRIEFFHHDAMAEWGGIAQQDSFAVIHPKDEEGTHGLYVVFHSAGHDLYSAIGCTFAVDNHDIYRTPDDMFGLYLDCRAHQERDFWWGGNNCSTIQREERRNIIQPVEARVLATVKWVLENYDIDRNRVYACGNSMGGSGALGIGMSHGEIFAAVKANVPAGVEHFMDRCFGEENKVAELPVCIDYSAQNDSWSKGHEKLYRAAREHHFALYGYWAAFGHADNNSQMLPKNDLIHSLDWLSIRKNEAYPAFTNADTDDANPWEAGNLQSEAAGQVNAFFRWQCIADEKNEFRMRLYLESAEKLKTRFKVPEVAQADVSFRRLQQFKVAPFAKVNWQYGGQTGCIDADETGLVTIPKLRITDGILSLELCNH